MVMDGRGNVNATSRYRDRVLEGYVNREEWQAIRDNAVNRHRQSMNIDKTMAHSRPDTAQMKTMTIGRYPRQAPNPVNLEQTALLRSGNNSREVKPVSAPGIAQSRINDHVERTPKEDYYSMSVTLPRPMTSRDSNSQQSCTQMADAYNLEAEKINTLRNLRKIHIDDEGKMVINDDLYAPILYHTADTRPRPKPPHHVQPPIRNMRSESKDSRKLSEQVNSDLVDSGNNSMTESNDTAQLEEIALLEEGQMEGHDNRYNDDVNRERTILTDQQLMEGQVDQENTGIFGNMKRMLASFFETFDESDAESATTEGSSILPRLPIVEGEVTTIEIQRGCFDLGISIVGGCDTPLVCVVIQEVFPDGVVAKDGRLQPGDQLLEVNGVDLSQASHLQARQALKQLYPICRLAVYREKSDESNLFEKEELIKVSLPKLPGKQLGIKLVGKKTGPGLFVLEIIEGGMAAHDGRLQRDDRILEINCQDMTLGTQEQAAHIIKASVDKVQFVLSRKIRPQTPDIVRSTSTDCLMKCGNLDRKHVLHHFPQPCREKTITLHKEPHESLGISVAGGLCSPRGDVPVYVTNINPNGCLGRTRQVKKGDVLLVINGHSLLNLSHAEAVKVLKSCAESKTLTINMLEGPETCDGINNFTPTWKYWLSMPKICQAVKAVVLERDNHVSGTLGFSIVGGCETISTCHSIYLKSIVPNSPAGKTGTLRGGDILLAVNGHSLENVTHNHAVAMLKSLRGRVTLKIVSWPGTLV